MVNYDNKPHDDNNSVCSTANRRKKEELLFIILFIQSDDQINFPWTPALGEENVYRNKLKSIHWCLDIRTKISLNLIEIEK